jgi:hypothetical protein
MPKSPQQTPAGLPVREALGRLGLSHAALTALIAEELDQAGIALLGAPVASAVAHAIESNNAEILRQLTAALRDLEQHRPEPPGEGE